MKRILNFVIAILICGNLFSQTSSSYRFRNPSVLNATTWKFLSVASGIDAIVTLTNSKNATINRIDDSSRYAYAWNPFIKYTSTTTNNSDSSYLEFNVSFIKRSDGTASTQSKLAMTVIDCDGTSAFREMVKVSQTATSLVYTGSLLSVTSDSKWLTTIGSSINSSGLDTTLYNTMNQINYSNVSSYTMRVGVVGKINAGTVRQSSFYFKGFSSMLVPLAVDLINFNGKSSNIKTELNWATVSEENLNNFEVYRSTDGLKYSAIGQVSARVNSNELVKYNFIDYSISEGSTIYYRLKMTDNSGDFKWSNIIMVKPISGNAKVTVFPNPTADFVNITLNADTEAGQINIIDTFGKTLQTEMNQINSNVQFDVRNLENGIYFVQILNNDGSTTSSKFIKR